MLPCHGFSGSVKTFPPTAAYVCMFLSFFMADSNSSKLLVNRRTGYEILTMLLMSLPVVRSFVSRVAACKAMLAWPRRQPDAKVK